MRKILAIGLVLILTLGFATTAFASPRWCGHYECFCRDGRWGGRGHHFWDSNGNFLSRADVETNLDVAVAEGTITTQDRDFLLERHDFCAVYGGGAFGQRRGGGGHGRFGRGTGRGFGHCRW